MSTPLVFIRGATGCGSTALAMQLDLHPRCTTVTPYYVLPEALLDWIELGLAPRLPAAGSAAFTAGARGFFDAFVDRCRAAEASAGHGYGTIAVHKSTMRADRLRDLLATFPDCRIIYLVRDPVGAVESIINVNIREQDAFATTVATAALRWHAELGAVAASGVLADPRVLAVHYRDLVGSPERTLERVHAFLGVEPCGAALAKAPNKYAARFVLDAAERRWIAEMTRTLRERLDIPDDALAMDVPAAHAGSESLHPERRLAHPPATLDLETMLRDAWRRADAIGAGRIAVFGLGAVTRLALPALAACDPAPIAILDEARHPGSATLGPEPGIPVRHLSAARDLDIRAAVVLSFEYGDRMLAQWRERFPDIDAVSLCPDAHDKDPARTSAPALQEALP